MWVTHSITESVSESWLADFTDVALVSEDTCGDDEDESYLVMKVILWWKISYDESDLVMKVK